MHTAVLVRTYYYGYMNCYGPQPDRLSLFQGVRAGFGRLSESGAMHPDCILIAIKHANPILILREDRRWPS